LVSTGRSADLIPLPKKGDKLRDLIKPRPKPVPGAPEQTKRAEDNSPNEKVHDEVNSGLETSEMIDSDPSAFRVSWIRWDSGFRGSGVEIGDEITAVNGRKVEKPASVEEMQRILPQSIGQY